MKKSSQSKPNASARTLPGVQYFEEVVRELKKVDWPNREQTIQQTVLVIVVSVVVAAYLGGLDYLFTQLTSLIIQ